MDYDEGYTTPPDQELEDLGKKFIHLDLDIVGVNSAVEDSDSGDSGDGFMEEIKWDEVQEECEKDVDNVTRLPTWDGMVEPLAYRRKRILNLSPTKQRDPHLLLPTLSFVSDDPKLAVQVIDKIWRIMPKTPSKLSFVLKELKSDPERPYYIELKYFIKNCIDLLSGRESRTFTYNTQRQCFKKNPRGLVHGLTPTALYNYVQPFIETGNFVRRLSKIGNEIVSLNSGEENVVYASFLRFIDEYLKIYQTLLMLHGPKITSFLQLKFFIKPFQKQLKSLEYILDAFVNQNIVILLAGLNNLLFIQEVPEISDLLRSLFSSCATAYLKYVSDWIFRGVLGPSNEFHIEKGVNRIYEDRRFWTKQFSQKEKIPSFIEKSSDLLYETGKAINLLTRIFNSSGNISPTNPFSFDTDVYLKPHLDFNSISNLRDEWDSKLLNFYEENSNLNKEIHESITEVIQSSSKLVEINFHLVEVTRRDLQLKIETMKMEREKKRRDRQQELSNMLQRQIDENKERKRKEISDDQKEYERMERYNKEIDERNLKWSQDKARGDLPSQWSNDNLYQIVAETQVLPSTSILNNSILSDEHDREHDISTIDFGGSGDNTMNRVQMNLNLSSNKSFSGDDSFNTSGPEEKFNPDNIVVTNAPQYKSDYDVNFDKPLFSPEEIEEKTKLINERKGKAKAEPHTMNYFLSQSISIPLEAQSRMVNTTLLHHMIVENNLYRHVEALNNFLALQNGVFAHHLCNLLVVEVREGRVQTSQDLYKRSGRLSEILSEALGIALESEENNPFIKNLTFTIGKEIATAKSTGSKSQRDSTASAQSDGSTSSSRFSSEYSILDELRLNYIVGWPLNIILTEEMMQHYEKLFGFLMQLMRAEILLEKASHIFKSEVFKGNRSHEFKMLYHYRYRMLHFVRTIRSYVNVQVIHVCWTNLCNTFYKSDSLEKIYSVLVRHIKHVSSSCLLGPKAEGVLKLLRCQLVVIESFCAQLELFSNSNKDFHAFDDGYKINTKFFQMLEEKFKVIEVLGKSFIDVVYKLVEKGNYPNVKYFLGLYNFNEFFTSKAQL